MGPSALQQEQSCENNKQTARFDQLNRNARHVRCLLHGDAPANRFSVAAACKKQPILPQKWKSRNAGAIWSRKVCPFRRNTFA